MEGEYPARARFGIAPVLEGHFPAVGLVVEDERVGPAREVLRQFGHVAVGLLGHGAQGGADLLGLDDAALPPTKSR